MQISTSRSLAQTLAIASLDLYQTHISPRKGFACPHRLLHGGESCSDYVKRMVGEHSLISAIQTAPQRFRSCKGAAQTLQVQQAQGGCVVIPCCIPI